MKLLKRLRIAWYKVLVEYYTYQLSLLPSDIQRVNSVYRDLFDKSLERFREAHLEFALAYGEVAWYN